MSSTETRRKSPPPPGFDPRFITPPLLKEGAAWTVRSLAVDTAGRCNMACRYCAEPITMPKRGPMPPEILDAAWKFLFPDGIRAISPEALKNQMVSFHVGTGEPFLNFPLLQKLGKMVEKARSEGVENLHVFLTTNSTLLDEEIMDWLIASDWHVKISLDGPAAIHDKWRVFPGGEGTYDRTARAVTYMAEKIPDRLAVFAVLCRGTDPAEAFDAIEKLGVRLVDMLPVAHTGEAIKLGPEDIENYRKFIATYAARFLENEDTDGIETKPPPVINIFKQCMVRLMGYQKARINCGAGRNYLAVGPGGDLYPCGRFIGAAGYRLGHVNTGLEPGVTAFQEGAGRSYEKREACSRCWAAPLCAGPCFACAEMFGPGQGHPIDSHCDYMLTTAEAAVSLVNRLREQDPERLLLFLPGINDVIFD